MSFSKLNASAATLTRNRTEHDVSPFSGMCVTCIEGCPGLCEIGKSALRGSEVLYPQPFGRITVASQKDYPIDFSHFNIMGSAVGAHGVEADSDVAVFPNVRLDTTLGADGRLKLRYPWAIPGLGSTDIAGRNWEGLAIGAALSGVILTIGENVCGMDPKATFTDGRIKHSPDLERRVKTFKRWQRDGRGAVVVQANVEDTRLGVQEYAISELGVEAVEIKWGQGAKTIGGEVKVDNLEKAQMLKERGYIVLPDPADPEAIRAHKNRVFREFERHSRIGMVSEQAFLRRVEELRKAGAKYVFLKTGAYRPADLARAMKFSSIAKVDALTIDGAGGGTGMSPWRMMNEWGIPTVELESLAYQYAETLRRQGAYVPSIIVAGGFTLEDQIFKALALGAPYVKAIGMARAPITAAMVGKTVGDMVREGKVPANLKAYGTTVDEIFIGTMDLRKELGAQASDVPPAAVGVYTYFERLARGLQQIMCGQRKFNLETINRGDIMSLTREAAEVSGITYVTEVDKLEVDRILAARAESPSRNPTRKAQSKARARNRRLDARAGRR